MKRLSIRFRLAAWYTAALAAAIAVAGFGFWWSVRSSIHTSIDRDLWARVDAMRLFLATEGADGELHSLEEELVEEAAIAPTGTQYRISGRDRQWIYASPGTKNWHAAVPDGPSLPKQGRTETFYSGGRPYRVLTAAYPKGAIQIGIPVAEYYRMLDSVAWTAVFCSPALLLLSWAGGYWMSRRALAPIDLIQRTAEEIEVQNLARRLPLNGTGDELDRLSGTLNSMLGRLDAAFSRMVQFTADASHELRTPVAVIRTTAEVVRSRPRTNSEYEAALDRILAETERTTDLIQDLMVLARADSGNDGLVFEPVPLSEVVADACSEMRVLAESAGLQFNCSIKERCDLTGDEASIRRLLLILIDNAIQYTPPPGRVDVELKFEGSTGERWAVIEVRDSGIGIAADDLPYIFDRFYRGSKDRSRSTGGSGLGLAIAQWIAERHGGEILVESHVGRGSTFRLRAPAAKSCYVTQPS